MNIQGTIRDANALITLPAKAKAMADDSYTFTLKGLPLAWDEARVKQLLKPWARKNGFTALTVSATSIDLSKWHGKVRFFHPTTPKQVRATTLKQVTRYSPMTAS